MNDEGMKHLSKPRLRRKHRLPPECYKGPQCVSFTACVLDRRPALVDDEVVEAMVSHLARASGENGCTVPIYTFMPDHLHVLILGMSDESDAKAAMDKFKTLSAKWLVRHRPSVKWQGGYYDQLVNGHGRRDEQVPYIALNPVRAGLVANPLEWPYTGSIGHDLQQILGIKGREDPPAPED